MSKITAKYFQECDFCHKEVETEQEGLYRITLPGYFIEERGGIRTSLVKGVICPICMDKLRNSLAKFIDLKEVDYGGTVISWDKKEDENNG